MGLAVVRRASPTVAALVMSFVVLREPLPIVEVSAGGQLGWDVVVDAVVDVVLGNTLWGSQVRHGPAMRLCFLTARTSQPVWG